MTSLLLKPDPLTGLSLLSSSSSSSQRSHLLQKSPPLFFGRRALRRVRVRAAPPSTPLAVFFSLECTSRPEAAGNRPRKRGSVSSGLTGVPQQRPSALVSVGPAMIFSFLGDVVTQRMVGMRTVRLKRCCSLGSWNALSSACRCREEVVGEALSSLILHIPVVNLDKHGRFGSHGYLNSVVLDTMRGNSGLAAPPPPAQNKQPFPFLLWKCEISSVFAQQLLRY